MLIQADKDPALVRKEKKTVNVSKETGQYVLRDSKRIGSATNG